MAHCLQPNCTSGPGAQAYILQAQNGSPGEFGSFICFLVVVVDEMEKGKTSKRMTLASVDMVNSYEKNAHLCQNHAKAGYP
eukprot:359674-Pelagomonas_calceolata.AAC.1